MSCYPANPTRYSNSAAARRIPKEASAVSRRATQRSGEIAMTARRFAAAVVIAVFAAGCGSARAAGSHTITLTLVRHAQSAGNASRL